MSLTECSDLYTRARAMMSESQSNIDSLAQFMAARAALEDSYAKSLNKLSRTGLLVNEHSLHPDVFEAIASLRGDVANESVQHKEMAYSISKDVLEPLGQLKESTDMVTRVSSEAKRATKDVKSAYERCKKLYNRYLALHRRACDECASTGLPPPALWVPDTDRSHGDGGSDTQGYSNGGVEYDGGYSGTPDFESHGASEAEVNRLAPLPPPAIAPTSTAATATAASGSYIASESFRSAAISTAPAVVAAAADPVRRSSRFLLAAAAEQQHQQLGDSVHDFDAPRPSHSFEAEDMHDAVGAGKNEFAGGAAHGESSAVGAAHAAGSRPHPPPIHTHDKSMDTAPSGSAPQSGLSLLRSASDGSSTIVSPEHSTAAVAGEDGTCSPSKRSRSSSSSAAISGIASRSVGDGGSGSSGPRGVLVQVHEEEGGEGGGLESIPDPSSSTAAVASGRSPLFSSGGGSGPAVVSSSSATSSAGVYKVAAGRSRRVTSAVPSLASAVTEHPTAAGGSFQTASGRFRRIPGLPSSPPNPIRVATLHRKHSGGDADEAAAPTASAASEAAAAGAGAAHRAAVTVRNPFLPAVDDDDDDGYDHDQAGDGDDGEGGGGEEGGDVSFRLQQHRRQQAELRRHRQEQQLARSVAQDPSTPLQMMGFRPAEDNSASPGVSASAHLGGGSPLVSPTRRSSAPPATIAGLRDEMLAQFAAAAAHGGDGHGGFAVAVRREDAFAAAAAAGRAVRSGSRVEDSSPARSPAEIAATGIAGGGGWQHRRPSLAGSEYFHPRQQQFHDGGGGGTGAALDDSSHSGSGRDLHELLPAPHPHSARRGGGGHLHHHHHHAMLDGGIGHTTSSSSGGSAGGGILTGISDFFASATGAAGGGGGGSSLGDGGIEAIERSDSLSELGVGSVALGVAAVLGGGGGPLMHLQQQQQQAQQQAPLHGSSGRAGGGGGSYGGGSYGGNDGTDSVGGGGDDGGSADGSVETGGAGGDRGVGGGSGGWGSRLKGLTSWMGFGGDRGGGSGGGGASASSYSLSSVLAAPPSSVAANMTTEERLAAMRAHAQVAVAALEEARLECVDAWEAHARARARFRDHVTAAVTIFQEIERRRVEEVCDSMRRYTVAVSSMLANLQYDVQRLCTKIEAAGEAAAAEEEDGGDEDLDASGGGGQDAVTAGSPRQQPQAVAPGSPQPLAAGFGSRMMQIDASQYASTSMGPAASALAVVVSHDGINPGGGTLVPAPGGGFWWSAAPPEPPPPQRAAAGGASPLLRGISSRSIDRPPLGQPAVGSQTRRGSGADTLRRAAIASAATKTAGAEASATGYGAPGTPGGPPLGPPPPQPSAAGSGSAAGGGGGQPQPPPGKPPPVPGPGPSTESHSRAASAFPVAAAAAQRPPPAPPAPAPAATLPHQQQQPLQPQHQQQQESGSGKSGGVARFFRFGGGSGPAAGGSAGASSKPAVSSPLASKPVSAAGQQQAEAGGGSSGPGSSAGIRSFWSKIVGPGSGAGSGSNSAQTTPPAGVSDTSSGGSGKGSFFSRGGGSSSSSNSNNGSSGGSGKPRSGSGGSGDAALLAAAQRRGSFTPRGSPLGIGGNLGPKGGHNAAAAQYTDAGPIEYFVQAVFDPRGEALSIATMPALLRESLGPEWAAAHGGPPLVAAPVAAAAAAVSEGAEWPVTEEEMEAVGVTDGQGLDADAGSDASVVLPTAAAGGAGTAAAGEPAAPDLASISLAAFSAGFAPRSRSTSAAPLPQQQGALHGAGPGAGGAAATPSHGILNGGGKSPDGAASVLFCSSSGNGNGGDGERMGGDDRGHAATGAASEGADPRRARTPTTGEALDLVSPLRSDHATTTGEAPHAAAAASLAVAFPDAAAAAAAGGGGKGKYRPPRPSNVVGFVVPGALTSASTAPPPPAAAATVAALRDFSEFGDAPGSDVGELNPVAAALVSQVGALLSGSPEGLPRLIAALEARRGEGSVLTRLSCLALVRVVIRALDIAACTSEFGRARALMVMSQTFYTYLPPGEEVEELLDHPLVALSNTLRAGAAPAGAGSGGGGIGVGGGSGALALAEWSRHNAAHSAAAMATPAKSAPGTPAADATPGSAGSGKYSSPGTNPRVERRRVYVQAFVRHHHLWQNPGFWEAAVFDTLGAEITRMAVAAADGGAAAAAAGSSSASLSASSASAAASGRFASSRTAAAAAAAQQDREHDITQGQLGFFAYNMLAFNVDEASVRRLMDKYARFIRLDDAETARLMHSIDGFRGEHARQVAAEERERDARLAARASALLAADDAAAINWSPPAHSAIAAAAAEAAATARR